MLTRLVHRGIQSNVQRIYLPDITLFRDTNGNHFGESVMNDFQRCLMVETLYQNTITHTVNICEDEEGYTKWYVLHAEANAILKVASSTQACKGATLYITMSPCQGCSKLIHQAGITRLVYHNEYKDTSSLRFLEKAGVEISHIKELEE